MIPSSHQVSEAAIPHKVKSCSVLGMLMIDYVDAGIVRGTRPMRLPVTGRPNHAGTPGVSRPGLAACCFYCHVYCTTVRYYFKHPAVQMYFDDPAI